MRKKIEKNITTLSLVFFLLVGLSLLLYPTISNYWNSLHQSEAVASYSKEVRNTDELKLQKMFEEAEAYNQTLEKGTTPDLNLNSEDTSTYNDILDVTRTGIMGYVEIPELNTIMPIYHGTDEAVLQIAIGHVPGTSLPVGGKGAHSVISGHRGLPSAKLFTNINQLDNGDIFFIHVLGETLTYQVDQQLTVLPEDVEALAIDPDQDNVTLVTCTPYGVNTHRLLVRGHRIPTKNSIANTSAKKKTNRNWFIITAVVILILILLVITIGLVWHRKN